MTAQHRSSPREYAQGQKWTDDRIETLRDAVKAGLSASQIARRLGGVTRNAVIGKANRMGLGPIGGGRASKPGEAGSLTISTRRARASACRQPRPVRIIANKQTYVEAPARPPVLPEIKADAFAPILNAEPVAFGSRGCKWPVIGEYADMQCCGRARDGERPYCAEHAAVAFKPPEKKNSVAALRRMFRRYA